MNYTKDIETYLFVIDSHKEEIFQKYKELRSKPFEMDASLMLQNIKLTKQKNQP